MEKNLDYWIANHFLELALKETDSLEALEVNEEFILFSTYNYQVTVNFKDNKINYMILELPLDKYWDSVYEYRLDTESDLYQYIAEMATDIYYKVAYERQYSYQELSKILRLYDRMLNDDEIDFEYHKHTDKDEVLDQVLLAYNKEYGAFSKDS